MKDISGTDENGKIVGRWEWKRYHDNGQLWDEGRFEHGKKKGTWMVYDKKGELLKEQDFK